MPFLSTSTYFSKRELLLLLLISELLLFFAELLLLLLLLLLSEMIPGLLLLVLVEVVLVTALSGEEFFTGEKFITQGDKRLNPTTVSPQSAVESTCGLIAKQQ